MLPEDGRQIIVNGIVENYEIKEKSLAVYLKNCVCIDNEKSDFLKNQKNYKKTHIIYLHNLKFWKKWCIMENVDKKY